MVRCPVCRARMEETSVCRRCGCDLTLAFACRRKAQRLLQSGLHRLLQGDLQQAVLLATEAASLDCDETVRKIAAFILHCGKKVSSHATPPGTAPHPQAVNPPSQTQASVPPVPFGERDEGNIPPV